MKDPSTIESNQIWKDLEGAMWIVSGYHFGKVYLEKVGNIETKKTEMPTKFYQKYLLHRHANGKLA